MDKKAKQRFFVFLLFFGIICSLAAQYNEAEQRVFSPFVSRLSAEIRSNMIRLNWIDSPDVQGPLYIFRSYNPIDINSVKNMRAVVIPYGAQQYVDEIDEGYVYYYYIATSDIHGQRYNILIPFTNYISTGSAENMLTANIQTEDPTYLYETENTYEGEIVNLSAYADGKRAVIYFTNTSNNENLILYRNIQPITKIQDLINAVIVQTDTSLPLIDYPVPGNSYYYALFYDTEITRGIINIRPGQNATTYPVEIEGEAGKSSVRMRPMPFPAFSAKYGEGCAVPD